MTSSNVKGQCDPLTVCDRQVGRWQLDSKTSLTSGEGNFVNKNVITISQTVSKFFICDREVKSSVGCLVFLNFLGRVDLVAKVVEDMGCYYLHWQLMQLLQDMGENTVKERPVFRRPKIALQCILHYMLMRCKGFVFLKRCTSFLLAAVVFVH